MNVTYNQIIADIKDFFNRHLQVNLFVDMQYYDFNANGQNLYPATILVPQLSNISNTQMNLNFNMFFADLLNSDRTNTREVYSDMLDVARDFLSYFQDYEDSRDWCIQNDSTIQPFEEKFDDAIVAGWVLNFTVELPFSKSICDIPMEE